MADGSEELERNPAGHPHLSIKTRLILAFANLQFKLLCRNDGTVYRRLSFLLDPKAPATAAPTDGVSTHDHVVDPSRNLWFRVFLPAAPSSPPSHPVVVFFHGGGFASCSPGSLNYDQTCRSIARELPAIIVSVNYRLAPEHRCPAQYDDGIDTLRYLDSSDDPALTDLLKDGDLSRCILAGDSAGGNLAHHAARLWAEESAGARRIRIRGLVAIQPFFGGEERLPSEVREMWVPLLSMKQLDWMWKAFLPVGEDRDYWASNVFGARAGETGELREGFPPVMVVIGGCDRLQDRQRRYAEGLGERGKEVTLLEYPNAFHAFYMFPELEDCASFMEELRRFLHKVLM